MSLVRNHLPGAVEFFESQGYKVLERKGKWRTTNCMNCCNAVLSVPQYSYALDCWTVNKGSDLAQMRRVHTDAILNGLQDWPQAKRSR